MILLVSSGYPQLLQCLNMLFRSFLRSCCHVSVSSSSLLQSKDSVMAKVKEFAVCDMEEEEGQATVHGVMVEVTPI